MKFSRRNRSVRGFTLLEIVGVVALIAILAAVLAPRVASIIWRGKVHATLESIGGVKTATMDYLSANSSFPLRAGTGATDKAEPAGRFDADLVFGGHLEKLFSCGIGSQLDDGSVLSGRTHLRVQKAKVSKTIATPNSVTGGDNFNLDNDVATADFTAAQMVVSAFIPGVALADAIALNKQIDGLVNTGTSSDSRGRCLYNTADSSGKVTLYVYLAHY